MFDYAAMAKLRGSWVAIFRIFLLSAVLMCANMLLLFSSKDGRTLMYGPLPDKMKQQEAVIELDE